MSGDAIAVAEALVARGAPAEAVAALRAAAERGDANAGMLLAVWWLRGAPIARDLHQARAMLRRVVEIGHVDGALLEIALTANGSGGPRDWPRALRLLRTAAANDPVAATQLRLVEAMQLGPDGDPAAPPAAETLSADPVVRRFPGFLSPAECEHVARAGHNLLEPAVVVDPATGRRIAHPIRTSDVAVLGPANEDLVLQAIHRRIALASGHAVEQGEPLNVLRYAPGQQYRRHLDTLTGAHNQRVATMILYLNHGFGGGETCFPALDLVVRPRAGDALLFETVRADGRPDERMLHAGEPVTAGTKWIATRWIRQAPVDPWAMGEIGS